MPIANRAHVPSAEVPRATVLRKAMVDALSGRHHELQRQVLDVMRRVPRHAFAPDAPIEAVYADAPHDIGLGQTVSQPFVVAWMTSALRLTGVERVLEIGTGSGYQTAVLCELAREVYSIEIRPELAARSAVILAAAGYRNLHLRTGDGYAGWLDGAPFDRIMWTAAPPELPEALGAQLRDGGLLVGPIGTRDQVLGRWTNAGGALSFEPLGGVRFVPMIPDPEARASREK